jgi:hypothetical protein
MRAAVLTVSPKSWNLDFSPRRTPAVVGPLLRNRDRENDLEGADTMKNELDLIGCTRRSMKRYKIIVIPTTIKTKTET